MPNSQGIVQTNPQNKTTGQHRHDYSHFEDSLSYRLANTIRFGDYTPSFVMDGVPRDSIRLNTADSFDSLSLNAPFKGSVRKIKESFMVPLMAILPQNWDRIYVQPSNGDDVPVDANCVLQNFPHEFSSLWLSIYQLVGGNIPTTGDTVAKVNSFLTAVLRLLVLGEYIYSSGSLINVLGYKGNAQFKFVNGEYDSYDNWFDLVVNKLFTSFSYIAVNEPVGSSVVTHYFTGLGSTTVLDRYTKYGSFRGLLELFRENPACVIVSSSFSGSVTLAGYISAVLGDLSGTTGLFRLSNGPQFVLPNAASTFDGNPDPTALNPNTLNLSRVLAYQLICAHFYSNSSVDFIYTAELYRQYIHALWQGVYPTNAGYSFYNFNWNGIDCPYDYLSGNLLRSQLYGTSSSSLWTPTYAYFSGSVASVTNRLASFAAIFGFRKSLRYGDYFVGARPRALAPVNTDVSVSNNAVSVVDITRNIQAQRFANSVMRSRSKIEEYIKSMFGGQAPAPDYHNPFFLAREAEHIFGDEVQNTGAAQTSQANSRTANFASNMGRYTFTFENQDMHPCVYMQIISFDVKRFYTRSVERQFLHRSRYDMFNTDFQYIGDQPVYGIELGYAPIGSNMPDTFAYQSRDMEYKQRFDQASGGFVESLPGWLLTDRDRLAESNAGSGHLTPDFIRSYNTEFDQFFLSLTGYSLGSYFHFAVVTSNNVDAKRAMAVDPQILG